MLDTSEFQGLRFSWLHSLLATNPQRGIFKTGILFFVSYAVLQIHLLRSLHLVIRTL